MTTSKLVRKEPAPHKLFTVDEANTTLPLVRAIVTDLVGLTCDVIERMQRLAMLQGGKTKSVNDPFHEELVQIENGVERDRQRVMEYVEELRSLGVEPKSGSEGLVDFPAMIDGRKVYLCWKLGEPKVLHWHELDGGFSQRHPLPEPGPLGGGIDRN